VGRTSRRARRELPEPARHPSGPGAEGVPRGGGPAPGAARPGRPARSLRSPGDGNARGRRGERAGRDARLELRGAIHGQGSLGRRRPRRRSDSPRRNHFSRLVDRAHARASKSRLARAERVSEPVKYVFVTGGVVSSLGKGITAASLGRLLKARGLKVQVQKFDPYINVDPGTMSPFQHGEVFVTEDGAETDLDIGHYERFIDENLSRT